LFASSSRGEAVHSGRLGAVGVKKVKSTPHPDLLPQGAKEGESGKGAESCHAAEREKEEKLRRTREKKDRRL